MEKRIEELKTELERMVRIRGGRMEIIGTCVNVFFRCKSMMLTPTYETLETNLTHCIQFTKEHGRVGSIWPVTPSPIKNFGEIAGKIMKKKQAQDEAEEMNSMISDCYRTQSYYEAQERELEEILAAYEMTPEQYHDELSRRCKMSYRLHCMLRI